MISLFPQPETRRLFTDDQQQQQQQRQQHRQERQEQQQHHQYQPRQHHYLPFASDDLPLASSSFDLLEGSHDSVLTGDHMQSDIWASSAQFMPKLGRHSHHRESSLSSLASTAGPASPFAGATSNPQIAINDSAIESLPDMHSHEPTTVAHGSSYYQLPKSMNPYSGFHSLNGGLSEMAYPVAVAGPSRKARTDGSLLPAPELAGGSGGSHSVSVASSIAGDSPATPNVGETGDHVDRRRNGRRSTHGLAGIAEDDHMLTEPLGFGNVPKLDRTMTDVYGDELYNPNFTITSTSPSGAPVVTSPTNDLFTQRISAANSHHLSAAQSPSSSTSRARSPFRNGSPFAAPPVQDHSSDYALSTAPRMGEQHPTTQEAQFFSRHGGGGLEPETPKTISPKDAVLEFNDADNDGTFPLFPQDSMSFGMDALAKGTMETGVDESYLQTNGGNPAPSMPLMPSQMNLGIQVPQHYPFISRPNLRHDTPPRLSSSGSSSVGSRLNTPTNVTRPTATGAEGGTYTCTYHGCTLRFETPSLLQKHKREGHRQTQGLGTGRDLGMTSNLLNTQAGPHRCDRINPSTNKPCGTIFSRPYDLTRHEDTIHNARKLKVRCDMCTEDKTFSRADALTRHYRVCHPDVDLPGKHRRRGGG
ncbi:activating signal cointegrator 1 complex subunit 1 protein [Purpureocillium lavendulum]|uniref:Activating signal cointegrator 1 complex subunit 1 protein n=1 Tax=Purpureocillium lavendulum TaxID=1247861 RepID=A0AB34FPZ8_9HYPO|nr:activating signal cointegrator 1 complex subunit 1 protein [Purpureocillium lavendulum]